MFTIQYHRVTGNTNEAASKAIELMSAPGYKHAVFSTSPEVDDGTAVFEDGHEKLWPYFMAAIRVDDDVYVFDSVILNAVLVQRYDEVRAILDAAETAGNVHFTADGKSYFTAGLSPEKAARILCDRPLLELNASTRRDYFLRLSRGMTEGDLNRLRGAESSGSLPAADEITINASTRADHFRGMASGMTEADFDRFRFLP